MNLWTDIQNYVIPIIKVKYGRDSSVKGFDEIRSGLIYSGQMYSDKLIISRNDIQIELSTSLGLNDILNKFYACIKAIDRMRYNNNICVSIDEEDFICKIKVKK